MAAAMMPPVARVASLGADMDAVELAFRDMSRVMRDEGGFSEATRARVVERIGPISDPRTYSLIAISSREIPTEFSPESLAHDYDLNRLGNAVLDPMSPARRARGLSSSRRWA